jgi:hypothetical protein
MATRYRMMGDHDVALRVTPEYEFGRRIQLANVYRLVRNMDAESSRHGRALRDRR